MTITSGLPLPSIRSMNEQELARERLRLADLLAEMQQERLEMWPSLHARILEVLLRS